MLLAVGAVAACAGAVVHLTGALGSAEQAAYDARVQLRHPPAPKDVLVVAIDDETFARLGARWPFRRSLHARAIDRLHEAGAGEIVYDVQFTEPTRPAEDLALFDAIGRAGGAVLATSQIDRGRTRVLGGDANLARIHARAAASTLPVGTGGRLSAVPYAVDGLETLAVATVERVTGRALSSTAFPRAGALIDYRGGPGTFPALSFADLVQGRFDPRLVRGKIVVVGATAPSLQDVHATPASGRELVSGPEVQANAIWTALHGLPLRDAPPILDLALIVLLGLVAPLARLRLGILPAALVVFAAVAGYLLAAQAAFQAGTVLAVVPPLIALGLGGLGTVIASHLGESRARRREARDRAVLEELVRERTRDLHQSQLEVVQRLGQAAESRDEATGHHIERIGEVCRRIGLALGMSADEAELLRHASAMHDVGKIGIPDRILLKPGPLDPDEWKVMKTHTTLGARILQGSSSPLLQMAEVIARTHHERWGGGGYPEGLRGEEIPLVGRICAIADAFDALVSERPYKDAWPARDAVAEIRRQRGAHFDPRVVDAFLELELGAYRDAGDIPGHRMEPVAA
jgi:CHASE2 domain-containing sensor protein